MMSAKNIKYKESCIAKYITLIIIILSVIIVTVTTVLAIISKPEEIVKQKFAATISDYYENYLYQKALGPTSTKTTAELAKQYLKSGFPSITLRQLLLFDNEKYADSLSTVATHCDENKTFVTIYPEAPFSSTDYRIDYHYACTF